MHDDPTTIPLPPIIPPAALVARYWLSLRRGIVHLRECGCATRIAPRNLGWCSTLCDAEELIVEHGDNTVRIVRPGLCCLSGEASDYGYRRGGGR